MMYFLSFVPILWVQWVRPAFSDTSSNTTGPLATNPPAVIGRRCSSSCTGWGGPVLTPPAGSGCTPSAGLSVCCGWGSACGAVTWADADNIPPIASSPGNMAARSAQSMAVSISTVMPASIDQKVENPAAKTTIQARLFVSEFVGDAEPADLNQAFVVRRPDVQAFHPGRSNDPVRVRIARQRPRRRVVKMHVKRISILCALPSECIRPRLQRNSADPHRHLNNQVMRILSFHGVSGRKQHNAGYVAPPPVHNPRGGTHLRLDVLVLNLGPRRQHRGQFLLRRLPPCRLLRRQMRTHSQQQNSASKGPSCNSRIHHFGFLRDSHGTMPRRIAAVASCVRSVTPSLLSRLLMWVFTVASEIASSVAISLLLLPFTICSSTSASRGVRSSVPMRSASFSAMAGGMCALPA